MFNFVRIHWLFTRRRAHSLGPSIHEGRGYGSSLGPSTRLAISSIAYAARFQGDRELKYIREENPQLSDGEEDAALEGAGWPAFASGWRPPTTFLGMWKKGEEIEVKRFTGSLGPHVLGKSSALGVNTVHKAGHNKVDSKDTKCLCGIHNQSDLGCPRRSSDCKAEPRCWRSGCGRQHVRHAGQL